MNNELLSLDISPGGRWHPRAYAALNTALDDARSVSVPNDDSKYVVGHGGVVTFAVSSATSAPESLVWKFRASSTGAAILRTTPEIASPLLVYLVFPGADTKLPYDRRKGGRITAVVAQNSQREKNQRALQLLRKWQADETTSESDRKSLDETIAALNKSRQSARKLFL